MSAYLFGIVGTILICAILTAILPVGKTTSVIKGVAKLVCLLAIVAPIPSFLTQSGWWDIGGDTSKNGESFFVQTVIRTDESFIKYYSEMRIRETEGQLEEELSEKYAFTAKITLVWQFDGEAEEGYDTDKIKILQICVQTDGTYDEEKKMTVWEYLTKNYCGEVMIE